MYCSRVCWQLSPWWKVGLEIGGLEIEGLEPELCESGLLLCSGANTILLELGSSPKVI